MALIEVGSREVEYELQGGGELVLLLAASWWPLDAWMLSGFPQLREQYQVLAPNQRGIGGSSPTSGPYSADEQADDAAALLETLGLSGLARVIGFAQGCGVAMKLALRQPRLVRGLVLAAPSGGTPASAPAPSIREREHIAHAGFRQFIRHHALNDDFAFTPANYARYPERAQALADALWDHQGPEEEFLKHADSRQGYDPVEDGRHVGQPALILCGEEDDVARGNSTPVRTAQALAEAMPDARLQLIPGVRHMTFWEQPEAAWPPALEFLASL
ncbi:MAG TPA: alpha/beta hydrolase [Chloroflexota bacterium]